MEEEQEDNNLLRPSSSGDAEQGNSQGFTPAVEPEPIRILQLSQSFFVADTVEEDESMIPPTQEMLIPNTQPLADISDKEGNISNGNNDTTLSNLDETYMERLVKDVKQDDKRDDDDFLEFLGSQNDMTQDIPELEETQQLLSTRADLASYTSKDLDFKTAEDDEDDDWQLKFSETQETQELLSTAKMQLQEPDDIVAQLSAVLEEEKVDEFLKKDTNSDQSAKESEQENKEIFDIPEVIVQKQEEEEESENEIEPSQSCLRDDTYSAFRDQLTQIAQEARTSHSTPDCSMNGGPKTVKLDSKPFMGPSPIGMKPEGNETIVSEPVVSESEQTIDILSSESKLVSSPSKEVSKEEDIPILVLDTEPEQLPELSVAPEISKEENKTTVVCDTIDLLSSVDTTNEDLKSEDAPELEKQTEDVDSKKKSANNEKKLVKDSAEQKELEKDEHMKIFEEKAKVDEPMEISEKNLEENKPVEKSEEKLEANIPIETSEEKELEMKETVEISCEKILKKDELSVIPELDESKISKTGVSSTDEQEIADTSIENEQKSEAKEEGSEILTDTLPDTVPSEMLPPLTKSRLSRKQKIETKTLQPASIYEKFEKHPKAVVGSFKNTESLQKIFDNFYGIFLEHECMDAMLSLKPNEELKVKKVLDFTVRNNKVYLEQSLEIGTPGYHQRPIAFSPHSSSSSTTTSTVSTIKSLHSGEMADLSSSSSAKSANSSAVQLDSMTHSSLSSQDHGQKTSTQNSQQEPGSFGNIFNQQPKEVQGVDVELAVISPIRKQKAKPKPPVGRGRRGGRKAAPVIKTPALAKRKRGRAPKSAEVTTDDTSKEEETSASSSRPKKMPRRKKNETEQTPKTEVKESDVVPEIVVLEGNDPYKDSPYGSILPGVRVMARWKDGFYYPGVVQSQELEGRWSVRFDDHDVRAIPQENLIKVFNLDIGTAVFVMSSDNYYDPGIICGHYKDSTGSGYEVEINTGVTKRYPRSAVILSSEQAKLFTSSRPPTTPATMTINLDNIIDGKRKRKSIQSAESTASVKKSPRRISERISKIDPNLDSTESGSCTTDKEKKSEDTTEEAVAPRRKKRRAATTGAVKIRETITRGSGKQKQLFGEYAFLLTNSGRKPIRRAYDSGSLEEDDELLPFDKDELKELILSRGGEVVEKFDDILNCKRKNVYLLANTHLRTVKYIQCLAAGVLCVRHHWIQNCIYKGEILNVSSYVLPAGKSLLKDKIIEWHGKTDVLKGMKFCVSSAKESPFVYTWVPVLLSASAESVLKYNLPTSKSGSSMYVDVLVTNTLCPADVLQSAIKRKIPTVSTEWVIQSLIEGEVLPYDAHPKFKYDAAD
ncbi:hypothetical protein CDAR_491063 [Caerostris darwini]|uniref:BRCT domain-containing protein n=1 Tax=Caerostris darwini TaxID=1538125 RepID=A0AAV4X8E6_9ARAC|nr:hypothetical protein CDAR_491063 [Caerostris darwini]